MGTDIQPGDTVQHNVTQKVGIVEEFGNTRCLVRGDDGRTKKWLTYNIHKFMEGDVIPEAAPDTGPMGAVVSRYEPPTEPTLRSVPYAEPSVGITYVEDDADMTRPVPAAPRAMRVVVKPREEKKLVTGQQQTPPQEGETEVLDDLYRGVAQQFAAFKIKVREILGKAAEDHKITDILDQALLDMGLPPLVPRYEVKMVVPLDTDGVPPEEIQRTVVEWLQQASAEDVAAYITTTKAVDHG